MKVKSISNNNIISFKMLHVLEVCTSRSWGGMEMQVFKTAKALLERGHRVTLLCYPDSSLHREAIAGGVSCIIFPFGNSIHPLLILRLRRYLQNHPMDIIHIQFSRDLRFVVPAIEGFSPCLPIMLTKRVGSYVRKKDLLHRYLYSRVNLITAISQVIQQNVIDTCPIASSRVEVIYNGIQVDRFNQALKNRDEIRHSMNVKEGYIIIGMVGRFSPGKGHEEFLQAAKIIVDRRQKVQFWIIGEASYGESDYVESIKQLGRKLKLLDKVIFTGFREDIPGLMAAMDIVAVPSHAEAFGNVAIEAMATAKPVVASNCDGLIDIVVNHVTGIQIPAKNSVALAEALLCLIDNENLRKSYGKAGQQRARDMFDDVKQFNKIEQRLIDLVKAKK